MTGKVANHSVVVFLAVFLDSMTYVAYEAIRFSCLHAYFEAFLCHTHKLFLLWCSLTTNDEHTRGIGVVAVFDGGEIHIYYIANLQHVFLFRNAVANHFVDRGADAFGEAFIVETCRDGIMLLAILHADVVYLLRIHSWMNSSSNSIKHASVDNTSAPNTFNLFRGFYEISCWYELAFVLPIHDGAIHLCGFLSRQAVPTSFFQSYHANNG